MADGPLKTTSRLWRSAQLFVAFHKDRDGNLRDRPNVWPPENARATINEDPAETEIFIDLKSADRVDGRDAQIKLHPTRIVVSRASGIGWIGIVLDEYGVRLSINGRMIAIEADGALTLSRDDDPEDRISISSDGAVTKLASAVSSWMSPDGLTFFQDTPVSRSHLSPEGAYTQSKDPAP